MQLKMVIFPFGKKLNKMVPLTKANILHYHQTSPFQNNSLFPPEFTLIFRRTKSTYIKISKHDKSRNVWTKASEPSPSLCHHWVPGSYCKWLTCLILMPHAKVTHHAITINMPKPPCFIQSASQCHVQPIPLYAPNKLPACRYQLLLSPAKQPASLERSNFPNHLYRTMYCIMTTISKTRALA